MTRSGASWWRHSLLTVRGRASATMSSSVAPGSIQLLKCRGQRQPSHRETAITSRDILSRDIRKEVGHPP